MNVQLKKFHLDNRTIGFHPQTQNLEQVYTGQQRVPWNYTTGEVSFEWSNPTISSTESKVTESQFIYHSELLHLKALLKRFHLNVCTIDFWLLATVYKVYIWLYPVNVLWNSSHFIEPTIGFHSQIEKLQPLYPAK